VTDYFFGLSDRRKTVRRTRLCVAGVSPGGRRQGELMTHPKKPWSANFSERRVRQAASPMCRSAVTRCVTRAFNNRIMTRLRQSLTVPSHRVTLWAVRRCGVRLHLSPAPNAGGTDKESSTAGDPPPV